MDMKESRHRSLTRGRCRKELHYATSSLDTDECRVATQKSYSSSETLKAYEQDPGRLRYGGCVAELVHHETEEYVRQACGVNVHDGGKRDTDDLLSRPHYPLQGLAIRCGAVPKPGSDAAAQDALDGSSVEGATLADGYTTQDYMHGDCYDDCPQHHFSVTKDCNGVVPDRHGVTGMAAGHLQ
ncbi:hypothetical protein NFI96_015491 [Prochilodus magdalenae]|nr:hypothetical protein NFI96_015491 [Prochilodus magdalenae]